MSRVRRAETSSATSHRPAGPGSPSPPSGDVTFSRSWHSSATDGTAPTRRDQQCRRPARGGGPPFDVARSEALPDSDFHQLFLGASVNYGWRLGDKSMSLVEIPPLVCG